MINEELVTILRNHLSRYPKMQPLDVVKLLYQNEFGPGHLVSDPTSCLERLNNEYASIQKDVAGPLVEDIGNGYARVNLAALDTNIVPLEKLAELFVRSAKRVSGQKDEFLKTLTDLEAHFEVFSFCFSHEELNSYLSEYIADGCPMVSHSEAYRQSYHPAYRVVMVELMPEPLWKDLILQLSY